MVRKTSRPAELVWTVRALSDLEAIGDFIARDDESAARQWLMKLVRLAEKIAASPAIGRRVPEFGREELRETFLGRYRLVYRVAAHRVEVLTIFEGHRRLGDDVAPGDED